MWKHCRSLSIKKPEGYIHPLIRPLLQRASQFKQSKLQNIPIREERGREIRKSLYSVGGAYFFSADYSQIELRLMAHLSGDKNMISDFLSGNDIHAATASKIFGVDIGDVTREMRSRAKTSQLWDHLRISSFGLSERLTIGRKEAKELIDGYFSSYPGVKKYMDESIRNARAKGY